MASDSSRTRRPLNRHIVKAMGIFGGSQALVIALGILRNKFLAMWLGPLGVALNAIFISTQELIVSAVGLSLRTGGVRDLSAAVAAERPQVLANLLRVAATLALAGGALTLMLSPALSVWTMGGTTSSWWCFALLATGVAAAIALDADMAALQADGQLKALARIPVAAAAVCTLAAIPLYRLTGLQAVLPVYLLMTFTYAFMARRERRLHCLAPSASVSLRQAWRDAGPMLRLGGYLTVAAVAERLGGYLFIVYMTTSAGDTDLGLYQGGYTLINNYVMVIFTAISAEYYPRLAAVGRSAMRTRAFAGGEFKVAAWVLMPVVVAFISVSELVVRILYSSDFLPMVPYVDWGLCGIVARAFSYCLAFVILARGDGRTFLITEIAGAAIGLLLRIAGYRFGGFSGLGMAYILEYALYSLIVVWAWRRYGLRLSRGIAGLCVAGTALSAVAVALKLSIGWWAPAVVILPWLVPLALRRIFR